MPKKNLGVRTETQNGKLVPVGRAMSIEQIASESLESESLEPYKGYDLELHGRNNLQAAIASLARDAANGDEKARTELLDRVMGKPLQRTDVRSTNLTLVGFLDQIIEAEERESNGGITIDVGNERNTPEDIPEATGDIPLLR